MNRHTIKKYQNAISYLAADSLEGGRLIKVEAHPIAEHR